MLGEEQKRRNEKERQTYYGAKDYQTKEFIVQELKVVRQGSVESVGSLESLGRKE